MTPPDPDPKQTNAALRQSRTQFETVFEHAGVGIVVLDLSGQIVRVNPAWHEITGYRPKQVLGHPLHDYLVAPHAHRYHTLFDDLVAGEIDGERYRVDVQIGRKDGSAVWVNMIVSLMRHRRDEPDGAIVLVTDMSEQYETEAELREIRRKLARSRENARLYLARELHDGPMQELYAAQFLLQKLQRHLLESGKPVAETIQRTFADVNSKLREIAGELRPPVLAPFGLERAIRAQVDQFRERYPDHIVRLDLMPDEQTLPEYMRLTLYRIHQEILNNIAKHANATHVDIEFTLTERDILLEIRDDGCGFEVPARWIELARADHFGLLGAAERAEEIDGTLVVLSSPNKGTIVRVSAPIPAEATASRGPQQIEERQ